MHKILIGVLILSQFLLATRTASAAGETSCVPAALSHYLETIRQERTPAQVEAAVKCAIKLAPSRETTVLLSTRLEQILERAQKLHPQWPASDEATIAVALANALETLGSARGYEMIRAYLAIADWNAGRDQAFFSAVVSALDKPEGRAERASILAELYSLALRYWPASRGWDLVSACAHFRNTRPGHEEPEYIRGVLAALSRLEKAKDSPEKAAATASCERTLLSQLLTERIRQTFLRSPLDQLQADERRILDRFVARITPSPDTEVAKELATAFLSVPWNATVSGWKTRTPQGSCEDFRGDSAWRRADGLWCTKCTVHAGQLEQTYHFYPNPQGTVCTLQQVWFSYPTTSHGAVAATVEGLAGELGPGTPRLEVHGPGSAYWEDISYWSWKGRDLYVFRNKFVLSEDSPLPRVDIYAQDRELILAAQQEKAAEQAIARERERADATKEARLYREVGQQLPELVRRLEQSKDAESRARVLLDLAPNIAKDRSARAAQLYLADWLARELADPVKAQYVKDWERTTKALSAYGATYESGYDGAIYNHIFVQRIVQEGLTGYWADEAFLDWLEKSSVGSCADRDGFKRVIAGGEDFLKRNPRSHIRKALLLGLARAHETGWSLSLASGLVEAQNYRAGAEEHRKKAIAYYERFLSEFPNSNEAILARPGLARLRLGVDTNSREFYALCH